jgi:hypothetical protein
MHRNQENSAPKGAAEARLKEMDEGHVDFAQRDGFNFHELVNDLWLVVYLVLDT